MATLDTSQTRVLLMRQASSAAVGGATLVAVSVFYGGNSPFAWGIAAALAAVVAMPPRLYLWPFIVLFVAAGTMLLADIGVAAPVAAGLIGGAAVGPPTMRGRFEAASAGAIAAGLATIVASETTGTALLLANGATLASGVAAALVPAAVRFAESKRVAMPSDDVIRVALTEPYRAPVLTAGRLESQLRREAPDAQTRDGLTEVAHWVWQLGLTLQSLDRDLASIVVEDIAERRANLSVESDDSFVRDRVRGTADHLDRLLAHREVLNRERARVESLQVWALAYLEEARAGLAVARVLPGEHTPDALGPVLERLRAHADDRSSRRAAEREVRV